MPGSQSGYICPDCQTAEENLGAEVDLILSPPSGHRCMSTEETPGGTEGFIYRLLDMYPTPEIMREKAARLAGAAEKTSWRRR